MNLNELIKRDLDIFFNANEFAEEHSIGSKTILCIVDDQDTDKSLKYYEGTTTIEKIIRMKASELDFHITSGQDIVFDDEIVKVYSYKEVNGLVEMKLERAQGKLTHEIIIQVLDEITKKNGFTVGGWIDYQKCKAYVRNMSGDELFKNQTIIEKQQCMMKIAYVEGLEKSMRVLFNGKVYNIKHIDNIEYKNVFVDLICEVVE